MGKVDKEKARRLLREGCTYREVAKECDCAVSVLHKMFYSEIVNYSQENRHDFE